MKTLIIDRFEGVYAICEDHEGKFFAIEAGELPENAHEGDVLDISDDGTLAVNEQKQKNAEQKSAKSKMPCGDEISR